MNGENSATSKPSNPKDIIGSDKLPLDLWPGVATAYGALGLLDGMLKYGKVNWREVGIRGSIYIGAIKRHIDAIQEGEDCDPVTGVSHWSYVLANAAIYVDALEAGKLVDDRAMPTEAYRKTLEQLTPQVAKLKSLYKTRAVPKHYTTADLKRVPTPAPAVGDVIEVLSSRPGEYRHQTNTRTLLQHYEDMAAETARVHAAHDPEAL